MNAAWITVAPGLDVGLVPNDGIEKYTDHRALTALRVDGTIVIPLRGAQSKSLATLLGSFDSLLWALPSPGDTFSVEDQRDVWADQDADVAADCRNVDDQGPTLADGGRDGGAQSAHVGVISEVDRASGVDELSHNYSLSHGLVGTAEGRGDGPGAAETSRPADVQTASYLIRHGLDLIEKYGARS